MGVLVTLGIGILIIAVASLILGIGIKLIRENTKKDQ